MTFYGDNTKAGEVFKKTPQLGQRKSSEPIDPSSLPLSLAVGMGEHARIISSRLKTVPKPWEARLNLLYSQHITHLPQQLLVINLAFELLHIDADVVRSQWE